MPLNYGSNFPLLPLAVGSTAVYKELKVEEDNSFWALLATIGLSIIEAALSFTGIGAVASVALGVGFAAARAAVTSAITGKDFDWQSFGIDAATPFVSELGGGLIKGLKGISNARETAITLRGFAGEARGITSQIGHDVTSASTRLEEIASGVHDIEIGGEVFSPSQSGLLSTIEKGEAVSAGTSHLATSTEQLANRLDKVNIFNAHKTMSEIKSKIATIFEQAESKILNNVGSWTGVGLKEFVEGVGINKLLPELTAALSAAQHQLLSNVLETAALKATEAGIDTLSRRLGVKAVVIKALLPLIRNAPSEMTIAELVGKLIAKAAKMGIELSEENAQIIVMFVKSTDIGFFTLASKMGIKQAWYAKALKFEGKKFMEISHDVIKNVFQPGDFVGDMVQKGFAKLSKQLEKGVKKFFSKFTKLWKAVKETSKFFARTGGILVNSDVILGYKIISTDGIYDLIQISFYSNATGAKDPKARNHGGKKPVYKWATKLEQAKLVSGGMSYYLERFANSRGGRTTSSTVNDFFNALPIVSQMAASLLPVRELTRIVSMVSMIERGVKNYQKNGGSKIWEDFTKDVTGKTISGGARLVSKGIGTALGGGFLGSLVGKMLANYVRPILRDGKPENIGEFLKKEVKQVTRHSVNHATKHSAVMKGMRRGTTGMRLSKRIRGLGKV